MPYSLCDSTIVIAVQVLLQFCKTRTLETQFSVQVHPLFILSVADFILSILWMIGGVVWINPGDDGWARDDSNPHTGMCYVLAIATTVSHTLHSCT